MKTLKIIHARKNHKPFITENKKYIIVNENVTKYEVLDDLGRLSWENKDSFYYGFDSVKYGWKGIFTFATLISFPTPILNWSKECREISIGIVLPFMGFGVTYTLKPKL